MSMTKVRREKKKHWKEIKKAEKLKLENELKPKIDKYLRDKIDSLGLSPEDILTRTWCCEESMKLDKMTIAEMENFIENYIDK